MYFGLSSFCVFLLLASSTASEYEVKTTSRGKSALFNLPRNDQVLFGYRKNSSSTDYRFNLFLDGKRVYYGSGNLSLMGLEWRIFWITRREVVGPTLHIQIPENFRILRGRSLQISSRQPLQWQMFTLPLEQNFSVWTTSGWNETTFDVPERDVVFIGLRKTQIEVTDFRVFYFDELNSVGKNFTALPWEGWTFIRITRYVVYPRIASGHLSIPKPRRTLKGRKITVSSRDPVQWQIFSFPLQYSNELTTDSCLGDPGSTEEEHSLSSITIMAILCGVMFVIALTLRSYIGYLKRHSCGSAEDLQKITRSQKYNNSLQSTSTLKDY